MPLLGMATTALIVTGLYIVTQIYQTAEDRARGDRTLPVLLGPRRALRVAVLVLGAGGGVLVLMFGQRFGWAWAIPLTLFFAIVGMALLRWSQTFDEGRVMDNFRMAMRLATVSSFVLSLFLVVHLL